MPFLSEKEEKRLKRVIEPFMACFRVFMVV